MRYLGVVRYSSVSDRPDLSWCGKKARAGHFADVRGEIKKQEIRFKAVRDLILVGKTASVILGHSEVGVTQIYAESDRARAVAATKEML